MKQPFFRSLLWRYIQKLVTNQQELLHRVLVANLSVENSIPYRTVKIVRLERSFSVIKREILLFLYLWIFLFYLLDFFLRISSWLLLGGSCRFFLRFLYFCRSFLSFFRFYLRLYFSIYFGFLSLFTFCFCRVYFFRFLYFFGWWWSSISFSFLFWSSYSEGSLK